MVDEVLSNLRVIMVGSLQNKVSYIRQTASIFRHICRSCVPPGKREIEGQLWCFRDEFNRGGLWSEYVGRDGSIEFNCLSTENE